MEQILIDGLGEAQDDDGCDEQGCGEIEILVHQTVTAGDAADRSRNGSLRKRGHRWYPGDDLVKADARRTTCPEGK